MSDADLIEIASTRDEPLARHTTLELGGPARFFARVGDPSRIPALLDAAERRGLRIAILGGGSNLVVDDEGFEGLVLAMRTRGVSITRDGDAASVVAQAGEPWDALVERTVREDLAGLECLSGIPGLVGATPIQNVGAYGQEVSDTIASVRAYDRRARTEVELTPRDCAFGYRDSALKRDPDRFVVLAVRFELRASGAPTVRYAELERALADRPRTVSTVRDTVIRLRRTKSMVIDAADPNRRSAGSFFTNPILDASRADAVVARALADGVISDATQMPRWAQPEGRVKLAAGWLIERAGIAKGLRRGPVGISDKHALALVHHGGGTTRELLALAAEVQDAVRARFGVELEREPVRW